MIPPTPSHPSSLPLHVSAYLQTRARFIRTYQSRSKQRGGLPQSERSVSQPAVQNGDKKKKGAGGNSLFSENTIRQSACLLGTNVKRKKSFTVSYFGKAYFLRGWTRGFPQLSRSLQSHLYIPACREEHANTFHRFLELRGKTELDFSAARALQLKQWWTECSLRYQDSWGERCHFIMKLDWQRMIIICFYDNWQHLLVCDVDNAMAHVMMIFNMNKLLLKRQKYMNEWLCF